MIASDAIEQLGHDKSSRMYVYQSESQIQDSQSTILMDSITIYHPSRSAYNWLAESRTRLQDSQSTFSILS